MPKSTLRKLLVAAVFVAGIMIPMNGRTIVSVCNSGCTYTPATMANLQLAANNALAGDLIRVQAGATFTGTLVLRPKAGSTDITIETGVDATGNVLSSSLWPAAGVRLIPPSYTDNTNYSGLSTNYSGSLAKIIPSNTNEEAVRTSFPSETGSGCATAPCAPAHHWKLRLLDISAPVSPNAAQMIVALGTQAVSGDLPSGDTQNQASEEPYNITLDQVYVHGTDTKGCVHGIMVAAKNVTISNSWVSNCWNPDQDAQAIWWINTTGGLTVSNTYIEAGGENFLAGGDTPRMNFGFPGITMATSSVNGATLTAALPDYMRIGDCVAVEIGGSKREACISDIQASGANPRRLISFSPALATAPDVPGMLSGSVVPRGVNLLGNWFNTPLVWKDTAKDARKNLLEFKIGRDIVVTGNLLTNSWFKAQTGGGILLTPLNQYGGEYSSQIANVTLSYNRIQNATVCLVVLGTTSFDNFFTPRTDGVAVSHMSCENMDSVEWGAVPSPDYLPGIDVGVGGHTPFRQFPKNVTFDHIYLDHQTGQASIRATSDAGSAGAVAATLKLEGFQIKNSIIRNPATLAFYDSNEYQPHNSGVDSWNAVVSGGLCQNNSWAQESSSQWTFCTGSNFPTTNAIQDAALVNYAGGNFRVDQGCGSPSATCYDNAATDGSDLGPNWDTLLSLTDAARAGTAGGGGGGGGGSLTITTNSPLPDVTKNSLYSATFAVTGGTAPYSWSISSGAPPTGLSMSSAGILSGAPTSAAGTYTFTARAQDLGGTAQTKSMQLTVDNATVNCNRSSVRVSGMPVQGAKFVSTTEPTGLVCPGDEWSNTSTNPPTTYIAMGSSPNATWTRGFSAVPQVFTLRAVNSSFAATASAMDGTDAQEVDSPKHRVLLDLGHANEMRIMAQQNALAATATLRVDYSTNNGGAWTATNISVAMSTVADTFITGSWTPIPAPMKADVLVRVVFTNGNGTETPSVQNVYVSVK